MATTIVEATTLYLVLLYYHIIQSNLLSTGTPLSTSTGINLNETTY